MVIEGRLAVEIVSRTLNGCLINWGSEGLYMIFKKLVFRLVVYVVLLACVRL